VQHRHQLQVWGRVDRHHLAHETFVIQEAPIDGLLLLLAVLVLDLLRSLIGLKAQLRLLHLAAPQAPQPLPLRLQLRLHAGGPLLAAVAQRK
jgi:hypothetical protein